MNENISGKKFITEKSRGIITTGDIIIKIIDNIKISLVNKILPVIGIFTQDNTLSYPQWLNLPDRQTL